MHLYLSYIALDLAQERMRQAHAVRRAWVTSDLPTRPGAVRRAIASGLDLVSRGSATAAARIGANRADDAARPVATGR